jgi:hypothetical protein
MDDMTKQDSRRETRTEPAPAESKPAFKPVALPAVAAAVRATRARPTPPKDRKPPAILRKNALQG